MANSFSFEEAIGPTGGVPSTFADRTSKTTEGLELEDLGGVAGSDVVGELPKDSAIGTRLRELAKEYGVPEEYGLALAQQESGYNPKAFNSEYGATGMFQFTPENYKSRGFDPNDYEASAREAFADFKREMDKGGVDWAIKHHFAGPNTKGHGPKTRQYLADVSKRAKDIRGLLDADPAVAGVGGSSDAGPKQPVGSFSFEEAIGPTGGVDVPVAAKKESKPSQGFDLARDAPTANEIINNLKAVGNSAAKAAARSWEHVQNRFLTDTGQIPVDDPRYTPTRGAYDPFATERDIRARAARREADANAPNVPGFFANLENPAKLITEDSLPANFIEALNRAPEAERTKFWDARKVMMQQNIVDNPNQFPKVAVEEAQRAIDERAAKQDPGVREIWKNLKEAAKADPGKFAAGFANALVADPEMLFVPQVTGAKLVRRTAQLARQSEIVASRVAKTADRIIDAGSAGAALNMGMEAAAAASEGRDVTGADLAFSGGLGATLGGVGAALTRGHIARSKLTGGGKLSETDLHQVMKDLADEEGAIDQVIEGNVPPDIKARIEQTLGIQNMSKAEQKKWHDKRQNELNKTFAEQSLEADYLEFKAEEKILRADQLRQEHAERQAATAAEAERSAGFEQARQEDLRQRNARFAEEYDNALAARDKAVAEQSEGAWQQEEQLRNITKELDEAEILDAAHEDVPAVRRAMNSALRRDSNLATPKWQRGEVDPRLVARLGIGGIFAGTAYALAPEDKKIQSAFAAGLAGLAIPGGGRRSVLDRMRQSGMATMDGDIVGLLVKEGKLRPDKVDFLAKEAETIELAKKGDQRAYKELYEEYFPQITRFAKKYVREAGPRLGIDAEDVAQEAFVKAFRNLNSFDSSKSKFSTWLHNITKNESIDTIRTAQSERGGGEFDIQSSEMPGVVDPFGERYSRDAFDEGAGAEFEDTPEAQALRQDTEAQLIRAVEKLPERQREHFLLSRVEQYTAQEIADMKNVPLNTVLSDIKRAQDSVMETLAKDMGAKREALPETKQLADEVEEPVKRGRGRPPGKYGPYKQRQAGEVDPRLLRVGAVTALGAAAGFYLNDENRLLGAGIGALAGGLLMAKGHKGETVIKQITDKADYGLGVTSTRIMNKSKELWRRAIEHERVVLRDTHKYMKQVDPFLVKLNKLPKETRDILSRAVLTGKAEVTNRLLQAIGDEQLIKDWKSTRSALDSLGDQLTALKRFSKGTLDYFPRIVKDVDGLLKAIGKERGSYLEEAIKKADEQAIRKRGTGLTDLEKSLIINKVLRDDSKAGNQPGFAKNRGVEDITPELQKYYASPAESLHSYIRSAVEDIERAKFFGQDLQIIKDGSKEFTNVDQSVGNLVNRLMNEGKLTGKDAEEVAGLLKSRFINGERAPWEIIQAGKNLSYAGLLGNVVSASTQLGDAIIQGYTQDIRSALSATVRSLTGNKKVSMKDFGLSDHLAEEFVSTSKTSKALNKIFKYTLFKGIDEFGKNVALNASVLRNARLARSEGGVLKLVEKYGEYLAPGEMEQLIKDLQKGEATDLVNSIAFAELSRTQPISRLELPQAYLDHPNGRLLYQFKTFMLKQIDVARRDGYNEIKKGNIAKGIRNLTALGITLGIAGTATDKIKDFLKGDDIELEASDIPMNMLKTYGLSEYFLDQFLGVDKEEAAERREAGDENVRPQEAKPFAATVGMFVPPAKMFDEIIRGDKKAIRYIPWIGPLLYEKVVAEEANE